MLTNLKYESRAPKAMKHSTRSLETIKRGVEPTFITPPLKIPAEVPPRQVRARARARIDEGERGKASRRAREGRRGRVLLELAEEEDGKVPDQGGHNQPIQLLS